ncbi:hypothetical protein L9F63_026425, partial [Diploptera punctata]
MRGSVAYHGMDMMTGDVVAIIEWSFKCKPENKKKVTFSDDSDTSQTADLMKQLASNFFQLVSCICSIITVLGSKTCKVFFIL